MAIGPEGSALNASGRMVISWRHRLFVEALALTVLFSVLLALGASLAFLWDQRNRGEDGLERESLRPLDEEAPAHPSPNEPTP